MQIVRKSGFLSFKFSDSDWKNPKGGAAKIIVAIKGLGHVSTNPDGYTYDLDEKVWTIRDNESNRKYLDDLKKKHLSDPSQIQLI